MTFYIDTKKSGASRDISFSLKKCILCHPPGWNELVFLCIGTDRLTGDCLGPYVGKELLSHSAGGIHVLTPLLDKKSTWVMSPLEMVLFTQVLQFKKTCRLSAIFILQEL